MNRESWLSIWLHSWSEHRHEQNEVVESLKGLKENITQIEENKNTRLQLDSNYHFLLSFKSTRSGDSIRYRAIDKNFYFGIGMTNANIGRYDGFKSSGKTGTIEDDSLKQKILVLYQQTLAQLT